MLRPCSESPGCCEGAHGGIGCHSRAGTRKHFAVDVHGCPVTGISLLAEAVFGSKVGWYHGYIRPGALCVGIF